MYQGYMLGKCTVPDNRTNVPYSTVPYRTRKPYHCTVPYRTKEPYRTRKPYHCTVPYRTKEPYQPKETHGNKVRLRFPANSRKMEPYLVSMCLLRLVRFLGTVRYGTLVRFSGTVRFLGTVRYGTVVRLSDTVPWVFRYTCSAQYDSLAQCNWFVLICYCFSIICCNMWIVLFILL